MKKNNLEFIDIKDDAMRAYNKTIQNKLSETVWAGSCGSWYKTEEVLSLWFGRAEAKNARSAAIPSNVLKDCAIRTSNALQR